MKIVVRTTGQRDISSLKENIPNLIVIEDKNRDIMGTFYKALEICGQDSTIQLEDDIILCYNFYEKIFSVINQYENDVIQFFSMRKDDINIGTRYINGSKFMMNQCYYLPKGMANDFLSWKDNTEHTKDKDVVNGAGYDILMAYYFKERKIKYLNYCPNLVDHCVCVSLIDGRRSSKRQSLTFKY